MALEIASSSIVADGACLKKRQAGERIGIAINPKERLELPPRRILFRDEVERKEFLVRAFLRVWFLRPKDKKLLLPGYGRLIFNELKQYLLQFLVRSELGAKRFSTKKNFISIALEILSALKTQQGNEMQFTRFCALFAISV